jgi:hypothetical protein
MKSISKLMSAIVIAAVVPNAFAGYPVRFVTEQGDATFGPASALAQLRALRNKEGKKDTDAQLRTLPVDLILTTGQGDVSADVRGLNVKTIKVDGGQGDIVLQLPSAGEITGSIKSAQSTVQIVVPATRSVGIEIIKAEQADVVYGEVSQDAGIATNLTIESEQGNIYFTDRVLNENELDELLDAQENDE